MIKINYKILKKMQKIAKKTSFFKFRLTMISTMILCSIWLMILKILKCEKSLFQKKFIFNFNLAN